MPVGPILPYAPPAPQATTPASHAPAPLTGGMPYSWQWMLELPEVATNRPTAITGRAEIIPAENAALIFGPQSTLHGSTPPYSPFQKIPATGFPGPVFSIMTTLIVIGTCYLCYRFGDNLASVLRSIASPAATKKIEEAPSATLRFFLRSVTVTGAVALALFLGKLLADTAGEIPETVALLAAGGLLAVVLYRYIIMGLVGAVSGDTQIVRQLMLHNKIQASVCSLAFIPAALLYVCSAGESGGKTSLAICIVVLIASALFMAAKSFLFFRNREISFLQWFLYLCTVEILPFSFILLTTNG